MTVQDGEVSFNAVGFSIYVVTIKSTNSYNNTLLAGETATIWSTTNKYAVRVTAGGVEKVLTAGSSDPSSNSLTTANGMVITISRTNVSGGRADFTVTATAPATVSNAFTETVTVSKKTNYSGRGSNWDGTVTYTITAEETIEWFYGVDSTSMGVTLRMIDYSNASSINSALGSGSSTFVGAATKPGLVKSTLGSDGYPVSSTGSSLASWFSGGTAVNNLFQLTGDGYLYYNCARNYAYLDGSSFKLTDALGTPSNNVDSTYHLYERGNFMPYNMIGDTLSTNTNTYDLNGNLLSASDPAYGQELYLTDGTNFYFGMYMSAGFDQPEGGLVNGSPMTFEFTGDDDMWVFIDGVLVLDIGGIHVAQSGSINFATGAVSSPSGSTTLGALLGLSGNTFEDYTSHTIKVFYMERGAGASTLNIRFNLPTNPTRSITVNKTFSIDGGATTTTAPAGFAATFNLKNSEGNVIDSATYDQFVGGSYEFSNLDAATIPLKRSSPAPRRGISMTRLRPTEIPARAMASHSRRRREPASHLRIPTRQMEALTLPPPK